MSHNASNVFHLLDPVQTQLIPVYVSVNSNHWLSMHFHFISSPAANISNAKLEIWGKVYAIYSLLKSWYIIIHCIAQHGEEMWCKCWIDFGQDYSFQRLRVYMNIHNMCLWCSSEIDHLSRDWGTVFKTLYCASLQGAFTRLQSPIYNISAWHTTLISVSGYHLLPYYLIHTERLSRRVLPLNFWILFFLLTNMWLGILSKKK